MGKKLVNPNLPTKGETSHPIHSKPAYENIEPMPIQTKPLHQEIKEIVDQVKLEKNPYDFSLQKELEKVKIFVLLVDLLNNLPIRGKSLNSWMYLMSPHHNIV